MPLNEDLLESWDIHDRIHRYLLDALSEENLIAVSNSKGRSVGDQFAHIHNVRLMWIKSADPDSLAGLSKFERGQALSKRSLGESLEQSALAIRNLLAAALAEGGRIKGFKPHPTAFFAYLVSHESHHRGQIALTLKQAGTPLNKKIGYGLWEWGSR